MGLRLVSGSPKNLGGIISDDTGSGQGPSYRLRSRPLLKTRAPSAFRGGRLALSGQFVQSQGAVSDGDGVTRIVVQAASLRDKIEKLYPAHEGVTLRILNRAVDRHRVPARFLHQDRHLRTAQKAALAK